jgi:Zn-dependent protease/CBS domain-containing protein
MYSSSFQLGKVFGITIGINASLLLLAGMLIFSLANVQFPADLPDRAQIVYYGLGIIAAMLFFGSILWHELAHALMAQFLGIPVRQVILNMIGGLAEMEHHPRKAYQEFWIALIGPLSTLILGVGFLLMGAVTPDESAVEMVSRWLGRINLMLAALNMIPGFPLDGGRVLRAVVWWCTNNYMIGTRVATTGGRAFAVVLVGFALVEIFHLGDVFSAVWFIFVGMFLWNAAGAHLDIARKWNDLKDIPVSRALHQRVTLDPDWTVIYAMDVMSIHGPTSVAPVMRGDQLVGIFALESLVRIPRLSWGSVRVGHLMKSVVGVPSVSLETDLFDTLYQMERANADYMLVTVGAIPVGIVGRLDLIRLAERHRKTRTEPIG